MCIGWCMAPKKYMAYAQCDLKGSHFWICQMAMWKSPLIFRRHYGGGLKEGLHLLFGWQNWCSPFLLLHNCFQLRFRDKLFSPQPFCVVSVLWVLTPKGTENWTAAILPCSCIATGGFFWQDVPGCWRGFQYPWGSCIYCASHNFSSRASCQEGTSPLIVDCLWSPATFTEFCFLCLLAVWFQNLRLVKMESYKLTRLAGKFAQYPWRTQKPWAPYISLAPKPLGDSPHCL